jgi:hypothetical protein
MLYRWQQPRQLHQRADLLNAADDQDLRAGL